MHHRHLTALLATVLTVLTPQAGAQSSDTLKIGLIGPFSGGTADFGQSMRNGIELAWVDLVNGDAALATALQASLGNTG